MKELMCECGHAITKHGDVGCIAKVETGCFCLCRNTTAIFEARRVAGQWYRRALKAEKRLAELQKKYDAYQELVTVTVHQDKALCDENHLLQDQLASANERGDKTYAERLVDKTDWVLHIPAKMDADDSTVICPKCGTEFTPAGGKPALPEVCKWTKHGDFCYAGCSPNYIYETIGANFEYCPNCGLRIEVVGAPH